LWCYMMTSRVCDTWFNADLERSEPAWKIGGQMSECASTGTLREERGAKLHYLVWATGMLRNSPVPAKGTEMWTNYHRSPTLKPTSIASGLDCGRQAKAAGRGTRGGRILGGEGVRTCWRRRRRGGSRRRRARPHTAWARAPPKPCAAWAPPQPSSWLGTSDAFSFEREERESAPGGQVRVRALPSTASCNRCQRNAVALSVATTWTRSTLYPLLLRGFKDWRITFCVLLINKEVLVHAVLGWCHYVVIEMLPANINIE
jgi:hypothetical protein